MGNALGSALEKVRDFLPPEMLRERKLPSLADALRKVHFPQKVKEAETARKRLAYDELFLIELVLALRHRALKREDKTHRVDISAEIDEHIRRLFPFQLTAAQEKVLTEIVGDIRSAKPMNRLLQGDVGSGKTVVALYAMLCYVANKCQAALMAPTEILAQQHYQTVSRLLKDSRVRILPLIGGMPKRERRKSLAAIAAGEVDIVIGTHALIQADVNFAGLGIIVVDEQHKFGVMQRGSLIKKSLNPDVLIMTATPIPRTLTMTVFGDLDVSIIDRMPPGRKRVKTWWVPQRKLQGAYDFIRKEINRGRQAYFVYPLVEESTDEQTRRLKDATKMAELLGKDVFPEFRVGLLHGRMSSEEKESVMLAFRDGKIQVLVSTIVIEVGIDVPNATMMVIENAERFGLSQLHQLRGRIGRGSEESYCMLFGNPSRTSDGFKIAEEDLRLRGPGEFFGTRQHGLPELKIANIIEDYEVLRVARRDAFSVAQKKAVTAGGRSVQIDGAYCDAMLKEVRNRFADMVELIGVG
jgi:ATP-dependent DNA helicase RecG